ncbi:MAG: hypothetical protein FWC28_07375 [Proteobacteria bacterium]|nr:hypothetical protein [Pseudomonadota bacterium]
MMVSAVRPLDADCHVDANRFIARGSLNLNATSTYLVAIDLESVLEGVDTEGANEHLLASGKENRIVLTELTRQYFIYGEGGTSKQILAESEPITGVLEPNSATLLTIPLSMLGSVGVSTIRELLSEVREGAGLGTEVAVGAEVFIRFQLYGKIASTGKKVKTAPVDFPIFIYFGATLPICEDEEELAPVGPCGLYGGQDGFAPKCCVLNPTNGKCTG